METNNTYLKDVQKDLFSGNYSQIIDRIENIKENGNPEVIELLLDLYILTSDSEIKTIIFNLLTDLKISIGSEVLVSLLQKSKYATIKKELVSICWQTRLDFSKNISVFANILMKENLETAFEAYTLIEDHIANLSEKQKTELTDVFSNNTESLPREVQELTRLLLEDINNSQSSISDIQ